VVVAQTQVGKGKVVQSDIQRKTGERESFLSTIQPIPVPLFVEKTHHMFPDQDTKPNVMQRGK
jgi:hypothetical protein